MDEDRPVTNDTSSTGPSSRRELPPVTAKTSREVKADPRPYQQREGISTGDRLQAERRRRPGAVQTVGRTLLGFVLVAAVIVGIFLALGAVEDKSVPTAPWSKHGAPVVHPGPTGEQ